MYEETLKKLIKIEEGKGKKETIMLNYIIYLTEHLHLYQKGKEEAKEKINYILEQCEKNLKTKNTTWEIQLNDIKQKAKVI